MKLVLLLLFMASAPLNANANWYVDYSLYGDSEKLIGDNEYSFEWANVKCKVSKTEISELENGTSFEDRMLTCDLGNNIQVITSANCTVPQSLISKASSHLQFIIDNVLLSVSLRCGPQ